MAALFIANMNCEKVKKVNTTLQTTFHEKGVICDVISGSCDVMSKLLGLLNNYSAPHCRLDDPPPSNIR